jgi:hypothetical protein
MWKTRGPELFNIKNRVRYFLSGLEVSLAVYFLYLEDLGFVLF